MTHPNRRQIRLPARLVDALAGTLERALERLAPEPGQNDSLIAFGRRVLAELRERQRREATRGPKGDRP